MTYADFEKRIESAEREVIEEWDDSIGWKAATEFLIRIDTNISAIQNGDIELVD